MIKQLPCVIWDCKNHEMGFCRLTYPLMVEVIYDNKKHAECGEYTNKQEEIENE